MGIDLYPGDAGEEEEGQRGAFLGLEGELAGRRRCECHGGKACSSSGRVERVSCGQASQSKPWKHDQGNYDKLTLTWELRADPPHALEDREKTRRELRLEQVPRASRPRGDLSKQSGGYE